MVWAVTLLPSHRKFGHFGRSTLIKLGSEGHRAMAHPGCVEKGVAHGGRDGHDGSFACASGGNVFAIKEDSFDLRQVAKTRNAIRCEARIFDAAVFELNRFKEGSAESLNVCADDLVAETIGIDNRAAFKRGDQPNDLKLFGFGVADDFGAGGDVTSLFIARRDAEPLAFFAFFRRPSELFPACPH